MTPKLEDFISRASTGSLNDVYSLDKQQGLKSRSGDLGGRAVKVKKDTDASKAFFNALVDTTGSQKKANEIAGRIGWQNGSPLTKGHVQALRIEIMHDVGNPDGQKKLSDAQLLGLVKTARSGKRPMGVRDRLVRLAALSADEVKALEIGLTTFKADPKSNAAARKARYRQEFRNPQPRANANRPLKKIVIPKRTAPWMRDDVFSEKTFGAYMDKEEQELDAIHGGLKKAAQTKAGIAKVADHICTLYADYGQAREHLKTMAGDRRELKQADDALRGLQRGLQKLLWILRNAAKDQKVDFPDDGRIRQIMTAQG